MANLLSVNFRNALLCINDQFKLLVILSITFLTSFEAKATVTITKAPGGTSISADKAENAIMPAYTTLGSIVIAEGAVSDFSAGTNVTFTLIAPSGWKFNPASSISIYVAPSGDIVSFSVVSITSTLVTLQTTISGNVNADVISISGLQVRSVEGGNIPGAANIIRGGTAVIYGCIPGSIMANLSQAYGAINKLVITLPGQSFSDASLASTSGNSGTPINQTAGIAFNITKIRACDQFYNVVTNYFGVKNLVFSGPSNGATPPSYTTSVSFASGVSSTILNTILKKAEVTTISASDGTFSGPASSSFLVESGIQSKFLVEASSGGNIGTHITGIPFNIRITAADANNNPCTSGPNAYSGTVDISSTGILTTGSGTTPSFSSGVLASRTVSFSNQGTFTITATKTGGSETGTSNLFQVNYPAASLSTISPSCITPGGSTFVLIAIGTNFTPTSIVRFNGTNRSTTFVSATQLQATIPSSDISLPDIYSISIYVPGTGTSNPIVLNMNTATTDNVSICQGSSYTLPDGTVQSSTGTYVSVIPSVNGCDSTITTNLSVTGNPSRSESILFCPGTSYTLPDGSIQSTPGTYISYIANISGCDSAITTNLMYSPAPSLTATPIQIDCYGNTGSVILDVVNGIPPYTFGPEATTNLYQGTFNFTVTDAGGCVDHASATIDPPPAQLMLTATPTQIACFGGTGSVALTPSGGSPSYSFGGTPTLNLTAGNYNYQVTDNNGCTANASVTINASPSVLNAVTSVINTPCGTSAGTASVNASGGTAPYTYMWNTNPVRATNSISGLPTGIYIVVVTDSRGCTVSKTVTVGNSNAVQINITGKTGLCPGETTTLCATPGFASYSWSTGQTTQCISVSTADTFIVIATDTAGCSGVKSIFTRNSSLPVCSITGGTLCLSSVLTLRATTGYPSYQWSNGIKTSTNAVRSAGTYSVTIKNLDGCASTCSYTVNSPLRVSSTKSDAKCSNEFKGSATVNATFGIPPYSYLWSNGATTSSVSGLASGSYTVRTSDAGGCALTSPVTINSNRTTFDYSSSMTNFNSNGIAQNTYIWFSAVANITHSGNYPVTIRFVSQNINTTGLNLVPADAKLIITNAVSQASTVFTGGEWVTTAPPNLSGNYFVAGFAYQVSGAIAPNLSSVKWRGIWTASSSCVSSVRWKWSAATYSNFTTTNTALNIQPVDDASASPFGNSDFAGTPENYKPFCIPGALSIGAPDYVGTYTSEVSRKPCSSLDLCSPLRSAFSSLEEEESNLLVNVYPNPFGEKTNIVFERVDLAGRMVIEIYAMDGQRLKTIFDENIEVGVAYTAEFNASDLASGIYFYKMTCGNEETRGKLYLQK
ncbi:MAG: T9SS type A sorting domain-containing protein [Bacteroidia bacterium]|nr:T9SS type A sorting domain-containing protein [Bacteroidia bacterium]